MKKLFFLVIVCMFVSGVGAISSDLKETYSPGETAIVKLAGNILEPIFLSQIKIKRVNQAIGFEGDITKIGNDYYIWFIAPSNSGNYTLLIEDVHTTSGGLPTIEDFSQKFNVAGTQIDYSVNPGAIFETDNFEIVVNLYEDFDKVINVDFPEVREVILNPGINYIDFSVAEIIGTQTRTINIGHYALPAYIVGKGIAENASENDSNNPPSANCSDGKIDSNEICECGDDKECGNDDDNLAGKTCRSFGFDSGDLFCKDGCTNFDKSSCISEEEITNDEIIRKNYFFRFNPRMIKGTVLISEPSGEYRFGIINLGDKAIENMLLEYDKEILLIYPDEITDIGLNETFYFNLSLKGFDDDIREVVRASAGGNEDYLLIKISGTTNAGETETEYVGDESETEPLYYCSELNGLKCTGDEVCSGSEKITIDESACCVGTCKTSDTGGSYAWAGYLIAGIVILGLIIIWIKYKKTGKEKNPLERQVREIENKMP